MSTSGPENDWPEILAYESTVYSAEKDSTLIVNKLALRLRFKENPKDPSPK